ncbi:Zinc-finger domain of monoamine-oxidase A repressor R1 protein [Trifolium repens]|nr:Zinc-finger domain of monoamine-oxidase A repressor R1 protein [Trifolium repens]
MDLNLSPSQLNQTNVDANDNSLPQEMKMDVPMTMDLSPSQLNQTNVDANGNSLPQYREMTMDVQEPTNLLVHTAKASAVSESLNKKPTMKRVVVMGLSAFPIKGKKLGRPKAVKTGDEIAKKDCQITVVISDGDNAGEEPPMNPTPLHAERVIQEIPLPNGIEMKEILGNEFAPEHIGHALQFIEFCRVFGKALEFKKGAAGAILRSLTRKQNMRHVQNTLAIEIQIRLLSLIVSESDTQSASITASNGKSSWLNVLKNLITQSDRALKEFPLDWLDRGISGYYDLELSQKLILLNFICDEALGTKALREYIDDQNETFTEEKKAAKLKVAEAKEKERSLKLKLQDEMTKAATSKAAMSTELRKEMEKTGMSTELQEEMERTDMSTELREEKENTVMSTELKDEKGKKAVMSTEFQDEMEKAVVSTEASRSISEHDPLLANLRSEADKAHIDLLEAQAAIRKWKKYCEAVRIEPAYLDNNGKAFWQLRSCNDEYSILLQDVKRADGDSVQEKWFVYEPEQEDEVTRKTENAHCSFEANVPIGAVMGKNIAGFEA